MALFLCAILVQSYWIHELDSNRIEAREWAMAELIALGPPVVPALKAIETTDPELRYRIDIIVRTVEKPARYGIGLPGTRITFCADGEIFVVFGNGIVRTPKRVLHSFATLDHIFQRAMDMDILDIVSFHDDALELLEERYHQWPEYWSIDYVSAAGTTRSWSGYGSRPEWVEDLFRRLYPLVRP